MQETDNTLMENAVIGFFFMYMDIQRKMSAGADGFRRASGKKIFSARFAAMDIEFKSVFEYMGFIFFQSKKQQHTQYSAGKYFAGCYGEKRKPQGSDAVSV